MLDQMSDPDYYYHVALSKQIVATGFPETVPQVKDIGWDIVFTDKEYLFHVVTSLFYGLFGEAGIRAASVVFLILQSAVLLYQSFKNLGARLFLLPLIAIAMDPHFIRRMIMVRPQTLAVLLFVFILVGFVTKRKYMTLISSLLFALSYHGLQIPGLLITASLFTALIAKPDHIKLAGFCIAGLFMGILLNPYFPGNLEVLAQITNILRTTSQFAGEVSYGNEIYPWMTVEFLKYSLITFIVLALAFSCLGQLSQSSRDSEKEDFSQILFLVTTTCLFLALAMITPRGREYLIPCVVLLAIQVLRHIPVTGTALMLLMALTQFFAIHKYYPIIMASDADTEPRRALIAALEMLPSDEKAHVLNCNWSQAPYLMYTRPNLSFVDILDPSFLITTNQSLHDARMDLILGRAADLRFIVSDVFKAQYVLCRENIANLTLDADPHFERLYPKEPVRKSNLTSAIFKLKHAKPLPNFERQFVFSLPAARETWNDITADTPGAQQPLPTTYLNLLTKIPKESRLEKSASGDELISNCIYIKPKSMSAHVGASHIGVGGGPNVRLWLNDTPLFESESEPEILRSVNVLVPLEKPLRAQDTITAMICPGVTQKYLGLSLSFWTAAQMEDICTPKELGLHSDLDAPQWLFKSVQQKNCLAPMASRTNTVPLEPQKPGKKN